MSEQSDLRSTNLDGAVGPEEKFDDATSQEKGRPTEALGLDSESGDLTEPRIDARSACQSETVDTQSRGEGETTTPGENVAALDFLAPSNRTGAAGRLGPYVVLQRIGQGGMGVVLKALDERLGRTVAIKMLSPALASSSLARRRFEREARAAAAVCHDNVVTIHAVDEDAGRPYLVMQFVAGQSLQEKLDRDGPLSLNEILRIGAQVASGLAAAHAQGLIHRDIKPANLLLEHGVDRVKITDFGLARAIDDASLTDSGVVLGTPHYMSPEQARGEPVDHRTDLFSLGSVLFATCTGQPPFRADSTIAVLRKVSDDDPQSIRELNPDIPQWLAAIVAKLMAKDAGARFGSASEVAELLTQHLAHLHQPTTTIDVEPIVPGTPAIEGPRLARSQLMMVSVSIVIIVAITWWIASRSVGPGSASAKVAPLAPPPPESTGAAVLPPAGPPSPPFSVSAATAAPIATAMITPEAAKKAVDFIAAGARASSRGEIQTGIENYGEAIRIDPTNTAALLARASLCTDYRVLNWSGAIADTTEVIRLEPNNAEAFAIRADAHRRSGSLRRAIEDASECLRLDPGRQMAYAHRGAAYRGLGEWKHAILDLNEYLSHSPNSSWPLLDRAVAHLSLGDEAHALADINRAVELDPGVNHFRIFRAQVFARKKDYERAKADFAEAIRVSAVSEKNFAYQRRGEYELMLSQFEPAIADFTEAIRLSRKIAETKDTSVYGARARAYLARGETERAFADCEEAMRINPRSSWILGSRGFASARKGLWDRAVADFDEEAKRTPDMKPQMLNAKASALALAGRYDQAAATYDEARNANEGHVRAVLMCRGFYLDRARGDYKEALKNFDLPEHTAWPPAVFLFRGFILARLGQSDRALADFKKLMDIVEAGRADFFALDDFVARRLVFLLGRGEAYLGKQDLEHALADADEAVRFTPSSAEAWLLRARVHDKRGKSDLADADRRAAAQLVPDPIIALPQPGSAGADNPR